MIGDSLILNILVLLAVGGSIVGDNSYAIQKLEPSKGGCMISDLAHTDDHAICDQVDGLAYNGSECDVRGRAPDGDNLYETFTCLDGNWHHKQTGTDIGTIRVKRSFFSVIKIIIEVIKLITGTAEAFTAVAEMVTTIVCTVEIITGNRDRNCIEIQVPENNEAPYYETCPENGAKFYAAAGDDDVTIQWNEPVVKDKDGRIVSNKQTTTPLNGEKFAASVIGQPYVVWYEAGDTHGASAYCIFEVYAYIHECGALQYPSIEGQTIGSYNCTRAFKLDSVCTYTCNTGHRLTDTQTVTCQLNGDGEPGWTKQPKCETDGGWSDWTGWSGCDVNCGGGRQHRTRMCNNPVRTAYGADCTGDSTDTRSCNEDTCRSCGDRERTYGTINTGCNYTVNDMTSCNYTCRPGMSFPRGVRSIFQYECGPSTDYAWSPVTEDMPECQSFHAAQKLGIRTHVSYNGHVPDSQLDKLGASIRSKIKVIGCTEASRCTVTVSVAAESRSERDAGTTVSVHVGFDMTSSGDLNVETYLHNKTVSPALQELIDTLMLMNTIIEQLQNNTNAVLDVEIDGVPYTVDPDSVSLVGSIQCPKGFSALDDSCVQCPVGTRYETGTCTFCEVGTYQSQSAQSACNACPKGHTTAIMGANSVAKCSVKDHNDVPTVGCSSVTGGIAVVTAGVLATFLFVFM